MTDLKRKENWVADLAFEVALGYYDDESLLLKYEIPQSRLDLLRATDEFQRAVALYRREFDEGGQEFTIRDRTLASVVLEELSTIAAEDDASHAYRIAAIREVARLAGYGKEETGQQANQGFQVNITFSGSGSSEGVTVEHS